MQDLTTDGMLTVPKYRDEHINHANIKLQPNS